MPENFSSKKKERKLAKLKARSERSKQNVSTKRTFLIVVEGTTEENYFERFLSTHLSKTDNIKNSLIVNPPSTDPLSIVSTAISEYNKNPRYDHVICVFDRDEYHLSTNFTDALNLARTTKLKPRKAPTGGTLHNESVLHAIYSIPCFELWFLLNFELSTRCYPRTGSKSPADVLIDEHLKKNAVMSNYDKAAKENFDLVGHGNIEQIKLCMENAKVLDNHCKSTGSEEPQTKLHELIKELLRC